MQPVFQFFWINLKECIYRFTNRNYSTEFKPSNVISCMNHKYSGKPIANILYCNPYFFQFFRILLRITRKPKAFLRFSFVTSNDNMKKERCAKYRAATVQGNVIPTQLYSILPIDILQVFFSLGAIVLWRPHASQPHSDESQVDDSHYTFSKNVSGLFGSNTSLQVMTVTRSSVSDRLIMLWVQPGII